MLHEVNSWNAKWIVCFNDEKLQGVQLRLYRSMTNWLYVLYKFYPDLYKLITIPPQYLTQQWPNVLSVCCGNLKRTWETRLLQIGLTRLAHFENLWVFLRVRLTGVFDTPASSNLRHVGEITTIAFLEFFARIANSCSVTMCLSCLISRLMCTFILLFYRACVAFVIRPNLQSMHIMLQGPKIHSEIDQNAVVMWM